MALPLRGHWDVTQLGKKYPWLRVDQEALEEFRSPFRWVSETSTCSPTNSTRSIGNGDNDDQVEGSSQRRKMRARSRGEENRRVKYIRRRGKKLVMKTKVAARNQEKLFLQALNSSGSTSVMNNASFDDIPQLRLTSPERTALPSSFSIPTLTSVDVQAEYDRVESAGPVLELLQQDHAQLVQMRNQKKKKVKKRKPPNILALHFPFLSPKLSVSPSQPNKEEWMQATSILSTKALMDKYSKQLASLAEEEERIEQSVMARIAEEKARLPLEFLFERNLMRRSDAQQDGLRVVTAIFAKLQYRLVFAGFMHWKQFLENIKHEDRKREGLRVARLKAVAILERVSSEAYVGTLAGGFQRWKNSIQMMVEQECHLAAGVIQTAFRARRSRLHLQALRKAAQALDYRREQAIQSLLNFERYGTTMRWSTLRIGGDFAKQNRAARNLQLFLRRVAVRRRVAHRVLCREGAITIQAHWRAHVARKEVERRRAERVLRLAFEAKAAIQMQRAARGFLARSEALRRRQWLVIATQNAQQIQKWLRHCWSMAQLHVRFRERRRFIGAAKAHAAAEELARLHWRSAIAVQCVLRGLFARKVYARKLRAHQTEQAALYLQKFWRRRRGLYTLGLRFAERRERIVQQRLQAAITLQCAYRSFRARCDRYVRATEKERCRRATTIIQRRTRGMLTRNHYQKARQATLIIQCSIRCAIARHQRTRRISAIHKLQRWIRDVYAFRLARHVLEELRVAAKRRQVSAVLIQKLIRQYEAQQTARLFREALNLVNIEQRRYFGNEGGSGWATHQASSELLTYVTQRFLQDGSCFSTKESRWLRLQVQASRERLAREDHAAIYLQRRYRGYATRMAYWVHRLQLDELRSLKERKVLVLQCFARRWLARRRVRRVREQRRLAELKEAYVRERKRKEEEREWKERYEREQMELCVQRAQEAANQLREARREADLARVKAEAAAYRAQELAAEREIETLMKTPASKKSNDDEAKDEDKDKWEQLTDEYGNVYYFNETTGSSSWDPPSTPTAKNSKPTDEAEAKEPAEPETKEDKPKEVDPLEAILREGKCIKCQQAHSTKRCLDCEDSARAYYCTKCFKQEHADSGEEKSLRIKRRHDFEVVPEAAIIPARCESGMYCNADEDNVDATPNNQELTERGLAAYYCYVCLAAPQLESITLVDPNTKSNSDVVNSNVQSKSPDIKPGARDDEGVPTKPGCFYCEACFARAHKTAKQLRHVEKALRFRRGALLCCDCGDALAVRKCEACDGDKFCETCFTSAHSNSKRRSEKHSWTALEVMRDLLEHETDTYCVECDMRASTQLCNLCGDGFCDGCFAKTHSKGAKSRHTYLPWSVAAQHGDWIEIKDDKAMIYFNVETKESTTEKPAVLLSGEERHRLQLVEREQLQRSRQVELESEVVKLKEQLRELQAQERPQSRARTPASAEGNQRPTRGVKKPEKPEKRGVLGKLFGRKPKQRALTPEERQIIAEELADQVRAEKQPVGSVAFQQAMVHELAALAVASPQPGHEVIATTADDAKMTHEVSTTRRAHEANGDNGQNKQHLTQQLQHQNSRLAPRSAEIDESDATEPIQNHRPWTMDDEEGLVLNVIDKIVVGSTGQAIGKLMNRRLFGYVAAWSWNIIHETLASAIAPTGDSCVDMQDCTALNNFEALLGRTKTPSEMLRPPKRCPVDYTYQRRQVPIKAIQRDTYDSESLHRAVKAATRSHTHPASITSSRLTMKSKLRKKQHRAADTHAIPTGPQPGIPFSTEVARSGHHEGRHHVMSPRKLLTLRNATAAEHECDHIAKAEECCGPSTCPSSDPQTNELAETGLHLNIDTDSLDQGNSSTRTHRSPPPLSHSPSSIASSKRRPHPPGSAQNTQGNKMLRFGENEDEVHVEFVVQNSPPKRRKSSIKSVLPELDSGRITRLPFTAFSAFSNSKAAIADTDNDNDEEKEAQSLFDEDPLDQHFHSMPLSPGVKLQAGEESSTGPDLPKFASRMRRSTFVRMDTCALPTHIVDMSPSSNAILQNQDQVQPQRGKRTFITETAWDADFSTERKNISEERVVGHTRENILTEKSWGYCKPNELSAAAPNSCSCGSSTSLMLFRKHSKVQRPCRNCGQATTSSSNDPMDFTNLVKQRAFHMKPPCLPTSSSPLKRAPRASPRRVTSAPACSPLARRNLLLSKNTPRPGVESATSVL